jgi:hypothetical protein
MVTDTQLCRQGTILVRIHSFLKYIGGYYYTEQQGLQRSQIGIKAIKIMRRRVERSACGVAKKEQEHPRRKEHWQPHKKGERRKIQQTPEHKLKTQGEGEGFCDWRSPSSRNCQRRGTRQLYMYVREINTLTYTMSSSSSSKHLSKKRKLSKVWSRPNNDDRERQIAEFWGKTVELAEHSWVRTRTGKVYSYPAMVTSADRSAVPPAVDKPEEPPQTHLEREEELERDALLASQYMASLMDRFAEKEPKSPTRGKKSKKHDSKSRRRTGMDPPSDSPSDPSSSSESEDSSRSRRGTRRSSLFYRNRSSKKKRHKVPDEGLGPAIHGSVLRTAPTEDSTQIKLTRCSVSA